VTRLVLVLVLVAVLTVGCQARYDDPTTQPTPTATVTSGYVPDPAGEPADDCPLATVECPLPWVTPGAVIPSTGVCSTSYNPRKSLSAADKRKVLAAYGIPPGTPIAEWDHLEARWAGGRSDPFNVWPMVSVADKRRKDALEESLYRAVCKTRTLSLAEARKRLRSYWRWWPPASTTLRGTHD
jgi:hypothetical protein